MNLNENRWRRRRAGATALAALLLLGRPVFAAGEPVPVTLSRDGRAQYPVVIAENAAEATRAAAAELADYLGRIGGTEFAVVSGDGLSGIALGTPEDFPRLPFDPGFADGPFHREDCLLRTHENGAWLLGAAEMGVENAAWAFLDHLGYRQFFPGPTWEVIPGPQDITVAIDDFQRPSFYARRIWYGSGLAAYNRDHYHTWCRRNRARRGFSLHTGHAYGGIIRANAAAFRENPEYYALVGGERRLAGRVDGRGNIKFCIANPGLRRLVTDHAVRVINANPDRDSISMDPSDGGNWCECEPCAEMGSVSDRVVILANEVAAAINELGLGDKYVGIYAYASHSPPPAVDVHPKVIVSIATGFIRGGFSYAQLVEGWGRRGAILGVRDYFAVTPWDWDMPGRPRAAHIDYVKRIADDHRSGARFMSAESGDSWGTTGLGYYLAARFLWDVGAVERTEELVEDFLTRAFGPAREPMRVFYGLINGIDGQRRPLISEDLLGRMYRALDQARRLAGDDQAVQARLRDLVLYTRYAELNHKEPTAAWMEHAQRIRTTMMVHTRGLYRRTGRAHGVPENGDLPEPEEIYRMLAAGIAANDLFTFEPIEFSEELVPATPLGLAPVGVPGSIGRGEMNRSSRDWFLWLDEPGEIALEVTGGLIWRDRGHVRLSLFSPLEEFGEPVAVNDEVPPDRETRPVTLRTPFPGLHTLQVRDGDARHRVAFPENLPVTIRSGFRPQGTYRLYFYVPGGTKTVAGYIGGSRGGFFSSDGEQIYDFAAGDTPGYFDVPVPEGADRQLWRVDSSATLRLMTVPPWLARNERELLLPREVVTADAAR